MKFSPKLLGKNEHVILHLRTHIKALIPNIVANIVIVVAAVLAYVYLPLDWRPTSGWVILAVTITLVLTFGVWPWLNWLTSTYTVTNRRLITRTGVLTKTGHDIPLTRISDVSYEHSLLDRMFGCGTLVLQTSASDPLYLNDIPKVEKVHVMLTDLLFHHDLSQQDAFRDDSEESAPWDTQAGSSPVVPPSIPPAAQPDAALPAKPTDYSSRERPNAQPPRIIRNPDDSDPNAQRQ